MIKIDKLENLFASQKVHYNNGKIYTYNDGIFYKSMLNGNDVESLEFANNATVYNLKSDVLAYIESEALKVEQIKKNNTLVNLEFSKNIISVALSDSAMHTIVGNDDGTVNIVHNISAESILKFTLFSNGDSVEFVEFLEENIIIGTTKKHIILVNILEKGALAKIHSKVTISDIITSKENIVYRDDKNIFLIDILDLSDIQTINIASLDDQIIDMCFNIYSDSIYVLLKDKLLNIDFNSNIKTVPININDARSISIVDKDSLVIGFDSHTILIDNMDIDDSLLTANEDYNDNYDPTKIRFLTVDDSATIRLVIKKAILNNFKNVIVDEANDGKEAMAYLKKYPRTDVVLLDWNMPNMNGGEVVEAMSKIDKLSGVKIIMATTEGGKDRVKEMLSKGVKGYLVKPFRPSTVIPMIEKLIQLIQKERSENE